MDKDCSHTRGIQALCRVIATHAEESRSRDKERFKVALKRRRMCRRRPIDLLTNGQYRWD
jgi:hypothetical protein